MKGYKTIKEISNELNINRSFIMRLIRNNILTATKDDRGRYIIPEYLLWNIKLLAEDEDYLRSKINNNKHFLYSYHPENELPRSLLRGSSLNIN